MPRGGRREGAGRKPGTPNKANRELREVAREYTDQAVQVLADIMGGEKQPAAARVSAANAILDRGYGKPIQQTELTGKDGKDLIPETSDLDLARAMVFALTKAERQAPTTH